MPESTQPLISFITASFNSSQTIERTIESILSQEEKNFEYIIIDGASTDHTLKLLQEKEALFQEKGIPFQWVSEKDKGIYDAWNKGLKLASGKWISFIGSDDRFYPQASTVYTSYIQKNPTADFITAKARMTDQGRLIREFGEAWNWPTFRREMKILHAGGMHRREYFETYGNFDDRFKITGDYELLLRAKEQLQVVVIDQFLVEMDHGGVSSTEVFKALDEARRSKVKNGVRSKLMAYFDLYKVYLKIKLKQLLGKS